MNDLVHLQINDRFSWRSAGSFFAIAFFLLTVSGCAAVWNGGAPDPSFDIDTDIQELTKEFSDAANITNYYRSPSKEARDRFITGRLVLTDLQYLKFIRTMTSDKQNLDSATDILSLTLNLAGTLVGGARSKTNLAAVAAGATGSKTTVDKYYYYEKSIDALVATMNAKRKQILVGILEGLVLPLDKYPLPQAVTDLQQYYLAGTLNGAIQFIQGEATKKESESDAKIANIRTLSVFSQAGISTTKQLTDAIGSADLSLTKANKALKTLGVDEAKFPTTLDDAKDLLKGFVRRASTEDELSRVKAAFQSAGMIN